MKIRNGFVSNSSSSSFVFLTSENIHREVLKTFTEEQQETLNSITRPIKLGDVELRIFQQLVIQGECRPEISDDSFDEYKEKIIEMSKPDNKTFYSDYIDG